MSERIKKILINRDNLSEEDATAVIEDVRSMINYALEDEGATLEDIEDIISSDLGLEPDYLDDFLF